MKSGSFFDDLEHAPARIAWTYAGAGSAWIVVSDSLAAWVQGQPLAYLATDLLKGLLFIAATAGLVFLLVRRAVQRELVGRSELITARERFRSAATQFPYALAIFDREGQLLFLNERAAQLAGKPLGELLGRRIREIFPLPLANACCPMLDRVTHDRRAQSEVLEVPLESGPLQLAATVTPLLSDDGDLRELHLVLNDLTSVVQVQRRLQRLNRSLQAIGAANSVLVRATSEAELLQGFCDALVAPTGHRLVWVGMVVPGNPVLKMAASAGVATGYTENILVRCDDTPEGRGPSGSAVRTGRPQVCHDFNTEERMGPWRERAGKHGIRSCVALPLHSPSGVMGAVAIYSGESHRFDEEEVKLLTELTGDLAFGIEALRARAALAEAQDTLAKQGELLRRVLADQNEFICRFRPDGTLTYVNDAFVRFFGGSAETLLNTSWRPMAAADDLPRIEAHLASLTPANPIMVIENRVLNAAGEMRWVQFQNRALFNADGTLQETQSVGRDVTERKLMEDRMAELVTRANRFARALDQLATYIYMKDEAGRYFYANQLTLDFFGVTAEQLIGKDDTHFFPSDTAARLRESDARVLRGESTSEEIELVAPDGSRRVYWEIKTPLVKEGTGEIQGLCGISTDITERKESERELRASRERLAHEQARLRALLDSIPDLIFFKDTQSVYLGCNRAFEIYSGLTERELIGKTDLDLVSREQADFYRQKDREMLATGQPQRNEEWIPYKTGGGGHYETLKTPFRSHTGELLGLIGISRDVTERILSREQLTFKAKRDRTLLELPSAADRMTEKEFMQFALERAEELTGSPISFMHLINLDGETIELVAWSRRTLADYCHAAYQSHYPVREAGIWADALRERKTVVFNDYPAYQHKHGLPEGHAHMQRLISVPVLEGGRVTLLAGVGNKAQDYSEQDVLTVQLIADLVWRVVQRRRLETQRDGSLAHLNAIVATSPVGLISYDHDGHAQTANEAAARLVGATVEQLLAQNFREIQSWKTSGLLAAAERALERRQPERIETHFTSSFGKECWIAAQFVPFQRDAGSHMLMVMSDVSERERAAAQLRLQSAALQAAANTIVITDDRGTIQWVNDAFTRTTGYTREEAVGNNPRVLKSGKHPREFYEQMWKTIHGGEVWHGEIHNVRKDGSPLEEDATITPVRDAAGKISHFIAIKQDITERKSLERQLLRAQRLEGIGLLAGGIAHDLNNVLAPILMGADLLKLTARDEPVKQQLDSIVESAKRGADIVKQVLTFARGIEGERIPIEPKHVIKEMARMARETFPRNLRIQVDVPNDLWTVMGDPTQLHQVLLNLSVNARDAMPQGGILSYSARNVEVDPLLAQAQAHAKPGPHVVLRVQDTGTGIPPEVLDRIFEPFFTTKELGKGTGLGLSTAMGIVRSHGGFITVESEPGKGTAFEAWLPASPQAHRPEAKPAAMTLPRGQGELVLVVDDEGDILHVTRAMLERHGYRVITAGDGTLALTELSRHLGEVRLVITDILMPFMDGVQLIHALRRMAPELRVIASSGALGMPGQKDRTDEVKALGVRQILHKPYSVEQLLRTVHDELQPNAAF